MIKRKKNIVIFCVLLSVLIIATILYINKDLTKKYLLKYLPDRIQIITKLILDKKLINNFKNDYNTKFLPETQF